MNQEKIYEKSTERDFLKELYKRRREDSLEEGIQAVGIISGDNALYKINENDGYEPHVYSFAGLCSYINGGIYKKFKHGFMMPILQEQIPCLEQGCIEVRITSSPTRTVFSFTSSKELSYFQIHSIFILLIHANSLGFENINAGIASKNIKIGFGMDLLEVIDILEKYLDDKKELESNAVKK